MQAEVPITRWEGDTARASRDTVVVEEPLEIRVNGENLTVTMRTPGDDFALTAGLLLAEGIVQSAEDIGAMAYCADPEDPQLQNIVNVHLDTGWNRDAETTRWKRNFTATSSCGLCGKASIEAVKCLAPPLPASDFRVPIGVFRAFDAQLRAAQRIFARTGGLHAAGLFDGAGTLLALREDIGRHNAVDKLIGGELLAERLPLAERILMVSGRTSFEIMQKAAVARIPVLCAVSAPSSLAVQLAQDLNMTLIGFLRGDTMNIYAGAERILG
jgi:FdhD protein